MEDQKLGARIKEFKSRIEVSFSTCIVTLDDSVKTRERYATKLRKNYKNHLFETKRIREDEKLASVSLVLNKLYTK